MTEPYRTIVADPPWLERGGGKIKRGADRHYPLLSTSEIIRVMLQADQWRPDPAGAHLYLWVTNNFLPDGLEVMKALGFRYITNIAWCKDRIGLGQYFRGQHELCLFGVMGRLMTDIKPPTVVQAPRRRHSKKPPEFMEIIERASPLPRLELFSRRARPGWTAWGNEV